MLRGFGTMIDTKNGTSRRWVVGSDGVKRWHDTGDPAEGPWGHGDLMATAAVRYCLGRQSYIVGDCVDWLIGWWPSLSEGCRNVITRDVNEAFAKDDEARECGDTYRPLGMDMDRQQWERARALWLVPNAEINGPRPQAEGPR